MRPRTYALALVAATLAWTGILAGSSLLLQPPVGDLARIGRLDEKYYGTNLPQVRFGKTHFDVQAEGFDQDIVVLGDSFSLDQSSGWENYLAVETGARIATFPNDSPAWESILDDPTYQAHPAKVFVLESVERNLKTRFARSGACAGRAPAPSVRIDAPKMVPDTTLASRPTSQSLSTLSVSYAFDFMVAALKRRIGIETGQVVVADLSRPLFSSLMTRQLLFFEEDLRKATWKATDLDAIACGLRQIQDRVQMNGRSLFLVLLIPDKLSVYGPDLVDSVDAAWRDLSVLDRIDLRGINLVRADLDLESAVRAGQLDIYLPDDTHLGSKGHAIVGAAVANELRRRGVVPTSGR